MLKPHLRNHHTSHPTPPRGPAEPTRPGPAQPGPDTGPPARRTPRGPAQTPGPRHGGPHAARPRHRAPGTADPTRPGPDTGPQARRTPRGPARPRHRAPGTADPTPPGPARPPPSPGRAADLLLPPGRARAQKGSRESPGSAFGGRGRGFGARFRVARARRACALRPFRFPPPTRLCFRFRRGGPVRRPRVVGAGSARLAPRLGGAGTLRPPRAGPAFPRQPRAGPGSGEEAAIGGCGSKPARRPRPRLPFCTPPSEAGSGAGARGVESPTAAARELEDSRGPAKTHTRKGGGNPQTGLGSRRGAERLPRAPLPAVDTRGPLRATLAEGQGQHLLEGLWVGRNQRPSGELVELEARGLDGPFTQAFEIQSPQAALRAETHSGLGRVAECPVSPTAPARSPVCPHRQNRRVTAGWAALPLQPRTPGETGELAAVTGPPTPGLSASDGLTRMHSPSHHHRYTTIAAVTPNTITTLIATVTITTTTIIETITVTTTTTHQHHRHHHHRFCHHYEYHSHHSRHHHYYNHY
ncbi:basic proline-rich protein-like [Perognathus longimembris pacificus]|uniref:basic proline-rich protein-like n=1 Tax=Perognathus longimembris pacificus TaxID=214514 RepID=UPI0020189BC4|nr:basic proline-rich protein-like [Perognathus longimembris pacificus]